MADDTLIANRPRRALRRPERFRDDDFITYDKKRNSDNMDAFSEGDSSSKPTPAKKARKSDYQRKREEKVYFQVFKSFCLGVWYDYYPLTTRLTGERKITKET